VLRPEAASCQGPRLRRDGRRNLDDHPEHRAAAPQRADGCQGRHWAPTVSDASGDDPWDRREHRLDRHPERRQGRIQAGNQRSFQDRRDVGRGQRWGVRAECHRDLLARQDAAFQPMVTELAAAEEQCRPDAARSAA
jgi:hypothetical protein